MKHGLYKVEFRTPGGNGAGVLFVQDGKFRGGDGGFYYVGTYTETGDHITGSVLVKRHSAGVNGLVPDNTTINLSGAAKGDAATLDGTIAGRPGVKFHAHIQRLAD